MNDRAIVNPEVFEGLREIMEDDFSDIVAAFHNQAQEMWPQAATALAAEEYAVVERIAHGLKGSALSLGAEQLSDILESLERAAREANLPLIQAQHETADARLVETIEWVTTAMA